MTVRPTRRDLAAATALLLAVPFAGRAFARGEAAITFDGLYKSHGVLGLAFADDLVSLKGRRVRILGYMAPPLKPESRFFVLTRQPLAICPFCQSDADWPLDILVVYMDGAREMASAGSRVAVSGRLDLGSWTDPETGFVSQVRIMRAGFEPA